MPLAVESPGLGRQVLPLEPKTTLTSSTIYHFVIANACLIFVRVINCTVSVSAVKMQQFSMDDSSRLTLLAARGFLPRALMPKPLASSLYRELRTIVNRQRP